MIQGVKPDEKQPLDLQNDRLFFAFLGLLIFYEFSFLVHKIMFKSVLVMARITAR